MTFPVIPGSPQILGTLWVSGRCVESRAQVTTIPGSLKPILGILRPRRGILRLRREVHRVHGTLTPADPKSEFFCRAPIEPLGVCVCSPACVLACLLAVLPARLLVCLAFPPTRLPACLPVCLFAFRPACSSLSSSPPLACLPACLSARLFAWLFVCRMPFACLRACLSFVLSGRGPWGSCAVGSLGLFLWAGLSSESYHWPPVRCGFF